ncbi:hypothetical protein ABPG75_002240 [Micractinium tetrahymenae]
MARQLAVVLGALLLAANAPWALVQAANFETATVDGELAITSEWEGGFCGSLLTRNPGSNPSSSWAGLFTFSGGELTTGPNGNGEAQQRGATRWTFVPNDPAQMAIFPNSTVMVTFCCNAADNSQVQASFRVIFSYDYRGAGYSPPPPPPPSPPPPSPSPPPPSPSPPPPSPPPPSPPPPSPAPPSPPPPSPSPVAPAPAGGPQPAPAQAPTSAEDLVAGGPEPDGVVEQPSGAPAPATGSRKLLLV